MRAEFHLSQSKELPVEMTRFDDEPENIWYTMLIGKWDNGIKFYIRHDQLDNLVRVALDSMRDTPELVGVRVAHSPSINEDGGERN